MFTMLVYCFSFSVVLPTVTVPQQAQGDCAVSMDQRQLGGEEWRSAAQHSTVHTFGDVFGRAFGFPSSVHTHTCARAHTHTRIYIITYMLYGGLVSTQPMKAMYRWMVVCVAFVHSFFCCFVP